MKEFDRQLHERVRRAEKVLTTYLPKEEEASFCLNVVQAMNYSVLSGGKRLRPVLMESSFELFHGENRDLLHPFMAAIEMIHTYSLVHDDLPAMDNDLYRRGRKTTHAVYGAGMATLAGDGLLNFAFETALLSFAAAGNSTETERVISALRILADKAGIYGMVGGQGADLYAEHDQALLADEKQAEETLLYIHEHKTAAMIESSLMIGALLAGATKEQVDSMEQVGSKVGLAFQMQDDILDVTGNEKTLGKPIGSDEKNEKLTCVSLYGLSASEKKVKKLSDDAAAILMEQGAEKDSFLIDLIHFLIARQK